MKVCLYGEASSILKGSGIGTAIDHQKKALELAGVQVTRKHRDSYDLIDINTIGPRSAYVAHKMRWKGRPVVMHTHTTAEDFADSFKFSNKIAPSLRGYLKYFYEQADMLISPSHYTRGIVEGYGVTRPIKVVSNGVDAEAFRFDQGLRDKFRKSRGLSGIVPYSVGHVFKRKGVLDFIDMAEAMADTTFMWVGRVYKDLVGADVVKMVEKKPDNAIFTNYVKDVVAANCAGDIFLFPSYCENQGIAILEAACCERPLLVRDIPVYEGWLIHDRNCMKATDTEEFLDCLKKLRDDGALRDRLGQAAYEMSGEHSLERVGKQLAKAYETLL